MREDGANLDGRTAPSIKRENASLPAGADATTIGSGVIAPPDEAALRAAEHAAALEAAYNAGLQKSAEGRDAVKIYAARLELIVAQQMKDRKVHRRMRRQRKLREKPMRSKLKRPKKAQDDASSLSQTLKLVRQLATTVHSADLFTELSNKIQVELYSYGNTKLFSLLSLSLGDGPR